MKTQSQITGYCKIMLSVISFLFSLNGFSQSATNNDSQRLTSLQNVVQGIKEKNESIKNVEHINVMVNDMLVENLRDFTIDPKSIALVEVVVLEPKSGSGERINPSIIINTKKIR